MKFKNMHLAGPTAAASMLGLGLLFVTRLTSPTATLNRSRVNPDLRSKSYELSQVLYRFPQQGAKIVGGNGVALALPRELAANNFASRFTPEGFAPVGTQYASASFDAPDAIGYANESRGTSSYTPSFSRSGMSAGFAGGAVMGAIGSGVIASSYQSAPFPASIRASSSVADGATIAASLPDVATSADLTPVGSSAVRATSTSASSSAASTESSAPTSRPAASTSPRADVAELPAAPSPNDRVPVRNVVQAVASNTWVYEAIPDGVVTVPKPTSTPSSGPNVNPTLLNPVLWVPPVRPADVNNVSPNAGSPLPAGLSPLVTPEPSTVALLGAGMAALAIAARRRRSA